MAYRSADVVEVLAWGRRVGAVALDPATNVYAFEYDPAWVLSGVELAPLHMPLQSGVFEYPELSAATFHRLPALLADALPDAFGNALVNRWMAEQGVPSERITPLDRLAYAADRAMGALEFRPPAHDSATIPPTAVQLADLVVAARRTVGGEFDTDATAHDALQQLIQVGTSAGGARAKAVVAFNPTTSQVRSAYGQLADGFEHWLIKLDGVSSSGMDGREDRLGDSAPYGRIEFAYSQMARAAGIEMEQCRLLAEGPRRHFMTKRFDRGLLGERHHVISLCALAHLDFNMVGAHSYDQYLATARSLELDVEALQQAYRRMVFNVVAVNHDDHTKNFAFLRGEHGGWQLAPAYDVTHAYHPQSKWTSTHLLSVNGRFADIGLADLYAVGERHEVKAYKRVVREVLVAVDAWREVAAGAEVPDNAIATVWADIQQFRPR
ncbi:MAG: type II toxin-antitoxin system HipA family toxin [Actinomycetota bacterium]|nr:type II toxin-antitoxin system HipA family toxin [Actinomycetota bacterium]